jgi:hypothetical protein
MKYEYENNGVLNDTSRIGPYSAYLYDKEQNRIWAKAGEEIR